ncbi:MULTISPECIES: diacylglycerol kinase family protein [Dyadobacter]|uniref:Diacylglycerol kinase family protein n=1 Tax=Dyadobacter fanqingshengii TaxID=2906443 RepID=A0A9X1P7B7_9BACT|nr:MULTISPECIES: diacylglycerol kinase family protein [Dyadobacter]MCF0039385.1 diacylglycerol kinase family protein [Dyadobacter fanqingshengii]MCF2488332.1 diacylglycerol kinase family protein [Dyadobacter sp. CY347]USJ33801.1 diacylglycerol kinase family protein [Dyadobacter fanqingshengii]
MNGPIDFLKAARSFRFAGVGIYNLFRYENNARIHLMACILVLMAGVFFDISSVEWTIIIIQIALVLAAEAFNTSIEKLADLVMPDYHPVIKVVKDTAAAAVLLLAISAVLVGLIIFVPKFLLLF